MKNFALFIIPLLFGTITLIAQTNTFPADGSVGVDTTSPEAGWKLDVNGLGTIGTSGSARLYFGTTDPTTAMIQSRDLSINQKLVFFASSYNFNIGNVGIGTNSPSTLLDIYNPDHSNSILRISGTTEAPGNYSAVLLGAGTIKGRGKGGLLYEAYGTTYGLGKLHFAVNGAQGEATLTDTRMTILSNGCVGIGTTVPADKLSVNGDIRAKEIKIETAHWPDYVFNPDYRLLTLDEVKAYINQNRHLPEFPSAEQVSMEV